MFRHSLLGVTLLTCLAAAPATRPTAPLAAGGQFDHFGVVPTPPPAAQGWKRILEGGVGHIARWAHFGPSGKADSIVILEMEPAKGRSAEQYATAAATKMKGKAGKDGISMGGEPTFRFAGEREPGVPTMGLVAAKNDYIYVISGFGDNKELFPRTAMDDLAKTLKFIPLAEPWANTALRGEKFPIFNVFKIDPLNSMRPNPTPPPEGEISVSTFNFGAGKPDFIINMQALENGNKVTMNKLQELFPGKLNPQGKATWTNLPAKFPMAISSTFEAKQGQSTQKTRIGLVLLPANQEIVMVFFSFANNDPKAVAAYEKASEKIMQSIEPLENAAK